MANVSYLACNSHLEQVILNADVAQKVLLERKGVSKDIELDAERGTILVPKAGVYYINVRAQVGRKNVCQSEIPNIRIWIKRGENTPIDTGTFKNINIIRDTKGNAVISTLLPIQRTDTIEIYMSSNISDEVMLEPMGFSGESPSPSITVTMFQMGKDNEPDPE